MSVLESIRIKNSERARKWYSNNKQKALDRISLYNKEHPGERKQWTKEYRINIRKEIFSHYSNGLVKCACCGESHFEFLTLDHIYNNGAEERRKLGSSKRGGHNFYNWLKKQGYPEGYQVLCLNCNASKSWWGHCPHRKEETPFTTA